MRPWTKQSEFANGKRPMVRSFICQAPRIIRLRGGAGGSFSGRCGACSGCLALRAVEFSTRARWECQAHLLTWWCTFTYAGDREITYRQFQLFLKVLRKRIQPIKLRYVSTTERGDKSGRLHFHALLHFDGRVTKRTIAGLWPHGFTRLKTVGLSAMQDIARYIGGYAAKAGRLRCSTGYGKKGYEIVTTRLYAAIAQAPVGAYAGAPEDHVLGWSVPRAIFRADRADRRAAALLPASGRSARQIALLTALADDIPF